MSALNGELNRIYWFSAAERPIHDALDPLSIYIPMKFQLDSILNIHRYINNSTIIKRIKLIIHQAILINSFITSI